MKFELGGNQEEGKKIARVNFLKESIEQNTKPRREKERNASAKVCRNAVCQVALGTS